MDVYLRGLSNAQPLFIGWYKLIVIIRFFDNLIRSTRAPPRRGFLLPGDLLSTFVEESMSVDNNILPGHCCLCGIKNQRCLCPDCFRKWAVGGKLPAWLLAIQNPQKAETERERRNGARVERGPKVNSRSRGGARYAQGVKFVNLSDAEWGRIWD